MELLHIHITNLLILIHLSINYIYLIQKMNNQFLHLNQNYHYLFNNLIKFNLFFQQILHNYKNHIL